MPARLPPAVRGVDQEGPVLPSGAHQLLQALPRAWVLLVVGSVHHDDRDVGWKRLAAGVRAEDDRWPTPVTALPQERQIGAAEGEGHHRVGLELVQLGLDLRQERRRAQARRLGIGRPAEVQLEAGLLQPALPPGPQHQQAHPSAPRRARQAARGLLRGAVLREHRRGPREGGGSRGSIRRPRGHGRHRHGSRRRRAWRRGLLRGGRRGRAAAAAASRGDVHGGGHHGHRHEAACLLSRQDAGVRPARRGGRPRVDSRTSTDVRGHRLRQVGSP
mmetsp:Transcript_72763/g.196838  ORF Transcript_72763/g.196838 Transcript_72763/m.196838 type:complete len:274 (+) Transcript_72763:1774-2595(+)